MADDLDFSNVTADAFGINVSSQRIDDLDRLCLDHLRTIKAAGRIPRALDLACGDAAMAAHMHQAGAHVIAVDRALPGADQRVAGITYAEGDMRTPAQIPGPPQFDTILCQRAIHYLRYFDALYLLKHLRQRLTANGALYLSASGVNSELGTDYPSDTVVASRMSPLCHEMAKKHGIHHPVCLYRPDELAGLARAAGFSVAFLWESEFGNVKAVLVPDTQTESTPLRPEPGIRR
ncbi:class I SAM-dependent methyltransferase [Thioalkalivibrio thiocyanodenitrificans]|uniref:class I SAM-dependent methyltransferase n=1 Tax=Thioalkalivibrio thiocyanodenitrificans TaxID=243063 RepID=UPI0003810AB8|nr:class I SAM-dependent methyltransferase [Thioalkalivibrio thiocyanodenitrificans]